MVEECAHMYVAGQKGEALTVKRNANFCLVKWLFQSCFCLSLSELREAVAACQHHKLMLV